MKTLLLFLAFGLVGSVHLHAQDTDAIKAQFLRDLQSGDVEDGCKIVVYVVNAAANAACYLPDPTVSKVACAAAQVMNATAMSDMDPNMPNLINDAGVRVCQFTYASFNAGMTYTFDFAENQAEEIQETWNWLNSLEGAVQFMQYMTH